MRRLLLLLATLLLTGLLVTHPADAKKRKPTCAKLVKRDRGKVVSTSGGVTTYKRGNTVGFCAKRKPRLDDSAILDEGQTVKRAVGAGGRCAVAVATGGGQAPQFVLKDLKQRASSSGLSVGDDASATVDALALTTNCVVAWGQTVGGTATVRAQALTGQSSLQPGAPQEVATLSSPAGASTVSAKAQGRSVVVRWTDAGQAQTKTLP